MKQLIFILSFMIVNIGFGQNLDSFYGKTLHSKIKVIENDSMITGEIMYVKISEDYLEVSVESEISEAFYAEIIYPQPTKLSYTKKDNRLIVDNGLAEKNKSYQLLSLTIREEKVIGKVKLENKIEEFEFK